MKNLHSKLTTQIIHRLKHVIALTFLFSLTLTACVSLSTRAQAQEEPVYAVTVKNVDDQVMFQNEGNTTTIVVESPWGIGLAAFNLESGSPPGGIVLRLHLKGLEQFRLISGGEVISATIPTGAGLIAQSQMKISEDSQQVLHSFDASWLEIGIVSDSKKIPLESGYFEIVFPAKVVERYGESFEIQWIDFYR